MDTYIKSCHERWKMRAFYKQFSSNKYDKAVALQARWAKKGCLESSVIWPTNLILYRDISMHPHIKFDKAVIISKAVLHLNTIKWAWPNFQSLFLGLICIMNQNVLCTILGHAPMLLYWKFQSNRSIRNNVTAVFVFWTKWLPAAILDFRWRWHEQFKNNTWSPHCSQSYSFPGLVVPEKQIVLKNPKWLSGGHIEFRILIRWTIYDPLVVMLIHTKSEVNPSSSFRARVQKVEKFTPPPPTTDAGSPVMP